MYEIIAMSTKYVLTFIIYVFIFRIAKLIYRDIKSMTMWEDAKVTSPHLILMSSLESAEKQTGTEIFPLTHLTTIIGRALDCGIVLSDPHVSSRHVQIDRTHLGFTLTDLGSVNGTYINDVRLLNPVLLKEGDEILMGMSKLVFSEGGKYYG